jgi:PTS system fructose-specific IIC component
VNLGRYLNEDRVDLDLDSGFDEEHPVTHEGVVLRMAELLEGSSDIVNPTKLRIDLVNRERRAPSLPGHGVAMPHVRTLQARRLVMAVGISPSGLPLDDPGGLPVQLVIVLVAPPYDDKVYLTAYRALGEKLLREGWIETVVASSVAGEVLRALSAP